MVQALNEQDFADPSSRRIARGEQLGGAVQIWLDPLGRETATITPVSGGIVDPERREIAAGTALYRFASVADGAERAMAGGWWLERRELDQLIRFGQVNGRSLGYAVRQLCCVPPEWGSALNFLIVVRAAGVVAAWRGLANSATASLPAKSGGSSFTTRITARNDIAALRVPQLFIPGTRRPGATRALFGYVAQWQTEGAKDWIYGSGF